MAELLRCRPQQMVKAQARSSKSGWPLLPTDELLPPKSSIPSVRSELKQSKEETDLSRKEDASKKNFDVPLFSFQGGVGWTRIIHSRQGSFFVRQTKVSLKKATDVDRGAATAFVEFHLFIFFQHPGTMENENHALAFYSMATDTLITQQLLIQL